MSDLLKGTRAVDTGDNPWKSDASIDVGNVRFTKTDDPAILELNRLAQQERPKSDTQMKEVHLAHKEFNTNNVRAQKARMEDQSHHADEKQRIGRIMGYREIYARLTRILGRRRVHFNKPPDSPNEMFNNQWGVFVFMRGQERKIFDERLGPGWKHVGSVQYPFASEWGVVHTNGHDMMSGIKYWGWRSTLLGMVMQGAVTEQEAHDEFGVPVLGIQSKLYRQKLYGFRRQNTELRKS